MAEEQGVGLLGVKVIGTIVENKMENGYTLQTMVDNNDDTSGQEQSINSRASLNDCCVKKEPQDPAYYEYAIRNNSKISTEIKEERQSEWQDYEDVVFTCNRPEIKVKTEIPNEKENPYPTNLVMVKQEFTTDINQGQEEMMVKKEIPEPDKRSDTVGNVGKHPATGVKVEDEKKGHKCHICDKICEYPSVLRKHLRIHSGERPFVCDTCGKAFTFATHLKTHERRHTGERPYECYVCKESFICTTNLKEHIKLYSAGDEKEQKCKECDSKYFFSGQLKAHMKTHVPERPMYQCEKCQQVFSAVDLKLHKKDKLSCQQYLCDLCKEMFMNKSQLLHHGSVHNGVKPYKCSECSMTFDTNSQLLAHSHSHKDRRKFKCDVCGKAFMCSSHLKNHKTIHSKEKPFSCSMCDKQFATHSNYQAHVKCHTGDKPFRCTLCDKGFLYPSHLATHLRSHTGEKPHICPQCGTSFKHKGNLKEHLRSHSGERPYKCAVCGVTFKCASNLAHHKYTHQTDKEFQCHLCEKTFPYVIALRRHIKRHQDAENPKPITIFHPCYLCTSRFTYKSCLTRHLKRHAEKMDISLAEVIQKNMEAAKQQNDNLSQPQTAEEIIKYDDATTSNSSQLTETEQPEESQTVVGESKMVAEGSPKVNWQFEPMAGQAEGSQEINDSTDSKPLDRTFSQTGDSSLDSAAPHPYLKIDSVFHVKMEIEDSV